MLAAHSMMQKRITDLVLDSFGSQSYKKAMECLKVLRVESINVCIKHVPLAYSIKPRTIMHGRSQEKTMGA